MNTFFLQRYYTRSKVHTLEEAYTTLDEMIRWGKENQPDISALFPEDFDSSDSSTTTPATRYLKTLSETNNINIVILDTTSDRVFAPYGDARFQSRKLSEYIFGNGDRDSSNVVERFENYSIEQNRDEVSGSLYLESWGYFSDNTTCFLMSMPISSIQESTRFFNRFLLGIGGFSVLLGAVLVYIISRQITKPINNLAKLSRKMSSLDFSARYDGSSKDEIGILGTSMNEMSERLERVIGELRTANNELQTDIALKTQMAERQQEFVANVSHELKTPIALIQGYAEGLTEGLAEDEESRNYYCGVIQDEAKRMNRMVHELMNVSAIEQGKDLPDFALFDLSKVVHGVVEKSALLIHQKDARVEVDVPENTMVWADEFKIEEVLTNYLNNALNHLLPPNQISIYSERSSDQTIYIHVMNTGNPIPEQDLKRIWEKFYKVDKAHSRSYGGSGLGLSIVRAIAEAHHQRCGVKNTRTGVDFWFSMDGKEKQVIDLSGSDR